MPPPPQPAPPATPPQKPDELPNYDETVVVTGSKGEVKLVDAVPTMSVITSQAIETAPSANFAELLRTIPGVNITQVSARDINVTSRAATGTLATGQLALLDGRTLYQDFFGFVMWDFLPVNFNEVKQVEVIRGPASAIWGANALYGVVNVISKSPRELKGTSATFGFGGFDRPDADAGSLWYLSGTYADAPNERWSYKLSGGGYSQDALARPTGDIACDISSVWTGAPALASIRRLPTTARRSRSSTRASTTTTRTGASSHSRAASPAPTASCTPASVRSTSTADR